MGEKLKVLLIGLMLWCPQAMAADPRLMLNIIFCESGFRHDAIGDDGVSRGIAQFRKETFYEFAEMAQLDQRGMGRPDWMNPKQQVYLLEWGLDHGYGRRWTCYRKLKGLK